MKNRKQFLATEVLDPPQAIYTIFMIQLLFFPFLFLFSFISFYTASTVCLVCFALSLHPFPFSFPRVPLSLLQSKIPLLWLSCFFLYTLGSNITLPNKNHRVLKVETRKLCINCFKTLQKKACFVIC